MYRRISRLAKLPTLHRFILVLTTLCILIIIMSPASGTLTVKAQLSTSTATYHVDDFVSTRGHFDYLATGELISGHNKTDYEYYTTNHKIQNQFICPTQKEIAIYIHGEWTDEAAANEQFDRIAKSITINNYSIPLIGFSWDANTPLNKSGWEIAKKLQPIMVKNLPSLFRCLDYSQRCSD